MCFLIKVCTDYQIETTKSNIVELVEDSLQLSNLDIVASYIFNSKSYAMPTTSKIQNDMILPAVAAAKVCSWIQSLTYQVFELNYESRLYCK